MKVRELRDAIIPFAVATLALRNNWSSNHPFLDRNKWVPDGSFVDQNNVEVHLMRNWHKFDSKGIVEVHTPPGSSRVIKVQWHEEPDIKPSRLRADEEEAEAALRLQRELENRKPQSFGDWS